MQYKIVKERNKISEQTRYTILKKMFFGVWIPVRDERDNLLIYSTQKQAEKSKQQLEEQMAWEYEETIETS